MASLVVFQKAKQHCHRAVKPHARRVHKMLHNHHVHRHVFASAIISHGIKTMMEIGHIDGFESMITVLVGVSTIFLHLTGGE